MLHAGILGLIRNLNAAAESEINQLCCVQASTHRGIGVAREARKGARAGPSVLGVGSEYMYRDPSSLRLRLTLAVRVLRLRVVRHVSINLAQ